jgi:hypothetical protein
MLAGAMRRCSCPSFRRARTWLGLRTITYGWRIFPCRPTVPSIAPIARQVEAGERGIVVPSDTLLFRVFGIAEISRLAQVGGDLALERR